MEIEIFELSNTWGCAHREPGSDETIYGWEDLPWSTSLWLFGASGDAVEQILSAGLGNIISESPGAYGGTKRTVSVDVDELEKACRAFFDKMNASHKQQQEARNHCHYCGGTPVTDVDFFDAPVCEQCRG